MAKSTIKKRKGQALTTHRKQQEEIIKRFDNEMEATINRLKKQRKELAEQEAEKRKQIEEEIADAESEVIKKVENTKNVDMTNLQSIKKKNERLMLDLKTNIADLLQQLNANQRCKLFLSMKTLGQNLDQLKQDITNLSKSNKLQYYDVELNENALNEEDIKTASKLLFYREMDNSKRKRIPLFQFFLQMKSLRSRSLCFLFGHHLIITDYNGSSILVVKDIIKGIMQNNKKIERIALPSRPWATANVEGNKIAVTLPHEGTIRLITFSYSGKLLKSDDLKIDQYCYGIACSNNKLVVSYCGSHAKVQILDMSGKVLETFDKDSNGKPLFIDPHYLTVGPDNETIYVSDCVSSAVVSLTFDGKVMAVFKDDELKEPYQLTVDDSGTVFVCGQASNNVYQLSSDLTKVKILLDKKQGIDSPTGVTYCQNNNGLYVGLWNGTMQVFQLGLE